MRTVPRAENVSGAVTPSGGSELKQGLRRTERHTLEGGGVGPSAIPASIGQIDTDTESVTRRGAVLWSCRRRSSVRPRLVLRQFGEGFWRGARVLLGLRLSARRDFPQWPGTRASSLSESCIRSLSIVLVPHVEVEQP